MSLEGKRVLLRVTGSIAAYQAVERKPIEGSYRGWRIRSMPSPSSSVSR